MPRGVRFCALERQVAARAIRAASENSVKGADQKLATFEADVWRNVKKYQPPGDHPGKYSNRSSKNIVRLTKNGILCDIQKYSAAMRVINLSQPTGNLSDTDIHCMAIAHHLEKCVGLNYNFTTFGKSSFDTGVMWDNYLAWLELRDCPKFMESPVTTISKEHAATMNASKNVVGKKECIIDINDDDDNQQTNKITDTDYKYGDDVVGVPLSFTGSALKNDAKRTCYGIKKAKLELKQQKQEDDMKQTISGVKDDINALNETHKQMLNIMKSTVKKNNDMEILKILKIKYKAIRLTDKKEALALKVKIAEKSDDILRHYMEENIEAEIIPAIGSSPTIENYAPAIETPTALASIETIETPTAVAFKTMDTINIVETLQESDDHNDENRDPFHSDCDGTKKRLLDITTYHNNVSE